MDDFALRYSRQTLLEQIGKKGQLKLKDSRISIIGCGALGSASAELLSRAGVGSITLVDKDLVELSNLPRQSLYTESDVQNKTAKAEAAKNHLAKINSGTRFSQHVTEVTAENIDSFVKGFDCVIDGTDNFETRFIINESCVKHNIPWIYTGVLKTEGSLLTIIPGKTPCLKCVFNHPPLKTENANTAGVLNTTVSFAASLQVTEALKILLEKPESIKRGLLVFDLWQARLELIPIASPAKGQCPVCG